MRISVFVFVSSSQLNNIFSANFAFIYLHLILMDLVLTSPASSEDVDCLRELA